MDRRALLRTAAVGLAGGLAGCSGERRDESGPRNPPTSPEGGVPGETETPTPSRELRITGYTVQETDDGNLAVPVTVKNVADGQRTGTLVVTVTIGEDSHTKRQDVSVASGVEATLTFTFDVAYGRFSENGGLTLHWAAE